MPMQTTSLPVDATALKITANGVDYPILLDTDTFDRTGEDGDIPILPLCRGDEGIGEVLEGQWKKGWTGAWKAANPFTAILETTNNLIELGGLSNVQNVWVYGWIDGHHPIVMANATEVNVLLEIPTNTASGANQAFKFRFFITKDKIVSQPNSENDFIKIEMDVTNGGLLLQIYENIGGAGEALIFDGSTYDGASVRAASGRVTIWRIVFHDGVAGATAPSDDTHMHIYLKQSTTRALAEAATEYELIDAATPAHASPYDISDYLFTVGYPAYEIGTEDDTDNFKQDTDDEAMSDYLRVDYSPFSLKYDFVDADVGKGDVELWDGDPDISTSIQVFDEDHTFTNNAYLQNGLIRLRINEGTVNGIDVSYWTGATWQETISAYAVYLITDNEYLLHPFFLRIVKISPEETIIEVKLRESATEDDDYFALGWMTLKRGLYGFDFTIKEIYPLQTYQFYMLKAFGDRWVYAPDGNISDDDINTTFTNTTLSDNFMITFDDDVLAFLATISVDKKPDDFYGDGTGQAFFRVFGIEDEPTILLSIIPFSLVANLFIEAEDGDYTGTTPGNDVNASPPAGNNYVLLDAIGNFQTPAGEYSTYQFDAGDDLPEGRYLAVIRARYVDEETMQMYVWNDDDDVYRNEENAKVTKTLAATFGYHSVVFDITTADVTGTDTFAIVAEKSTDDTDEIRIDYFLIIPIGNGEDWPQDLAHAAMRGYNKPKRLFTR